MEKAISASLKSLLNVRVQEALCNFLDMAVLKCTCHQQEYCVGPQDLRIKTLPDSRDGDSLQQMVAAIISFALIVLKYNEGAEQRMVALTTLAHFAKVAEHNDRLALYSSPQLIDELVREYSFGLLTDK